MASSWPSSQLPTPPETPETSAQTAQAPSPVTEAPANGTTGTGPQQQPQRQPQQAPHTPETPVASRKYQARQTEPAPEASSPISPSSRLRRISIQEVVDDEPDTDDDEVEVIPRDIPPPATPAQRRRWRKQKGTFSLKHDNGRQETRASHPGLHSPTETVPFKPRRGSRASGYEESRQVLGRTSSKQIAEPKSRGLRVKLKLNLEVEITLKAQLHGDVLLTVL